MSAIALVSVVSVMAACSPRTDFDRPVMSTTNPDFIRNPGSYSATLGAEALAPTTPGQAELVGDVRLSDFKFTVQEKKLRNIGYRLTVPLGRGHYRESYVGARRYANRGVEPRPLSDGPTYYKWLRDGHERSGHSMWTRLRDDIRQDEVSASRFGFVAHRVLITDYDRHQAFLARGEIAPGELQNLTRRLAENRRYAETVRNSVADRLTAYRFAADRAQIEVPSDQQMYLVDSAIAALERQLAELEAILAYDYSGAKGRVATRDVSYEVIQAPILDESLYQYN